MTRLLKRSQCLGLFMVAALGLVACGSSSTSPKEDIADIGHDSPIEDAIADTPLDGVDATKDLPADAPADMIEPDEIDEQALIAQHIEDGRYWLKNAMPGYAASSFESALELDPENQDARFGAALGRYVEAIEMLGLLLNLPQQITGYAAGDGTKTVDPKDAESQSDYLALMVSDLLVNINGFFKDAEAHLELVDPDGLSWSIEQVPIYFNSREFMVLEGRFDRGDYHMIRSANSFFLWFTGFLAAMDFHTDLATAVVTGFELKGDMSAEVILELLVFMLEADNRFLGLQEKSGEALFNEGIDQMKAVGFHLLAALDYLENKDGAHDEDVSTYGVDGSDHVIVIHHRIAADSCEKIPIELVFTPEVIEQTEELLAALDQPGTVVPFSGALGLQLSTVLGAINQIGFLDHFAIELPLDISGFQTHQIQGLLATFLQDSIGMDYATLFETPTGLRTFLPKVAVPELGEGALPFGWECPGEIAEHGAPLKLAGFVCSADAELEDSGHFADTPYAMVSDGLPSPLPYMIWDDPALAGLVHVDVAFGVGDPDFVSPTLKELNWGIHTLLANILGLLR